MSDEPAGTPATQPTQPDTPLPPETVVPEAEAAADHPAVPDTNLYTTGYCLTCGLWIVKGFGGWQHAEEATS